MCLFHEHGGHGHSHGHTQDRGTHSHISALANRYVCFHCKTNPVVVNHIMNRHNNLKNNLTCIVSSKYRDGEEGEKNEQGNLTSVTVQGKHETHSHGHSHGKGDSTGNLNMRGVFLHVMADALGSVIVIISALVMWQAPDWRFAIYVDPGIYDFSI